jgi:hypothetical protein
MVSFAGLLLLMSSAMESNATRNFSLADDIEMSRIKSPTDPAVLSPDGRYLAVITERGLLDRNVVEDSIWIWNTNEVRRFINDTKQAEPPLPIRLVKMATSKKGPLIAGLRWLDDSSGLVFIGIAENGNAQIFEAQVSAKALKTLTLPDQDVVSFDIRNGNLAYSVRSAELLSPKQYKAKKPAFITAANLIDLLWPLDHYPERARAEFNYCDLWAVIDGRRFRVERPETHEPLHLYQWGAFYDSQGKFSLSPNGRELVTYDAVAIVPEEWRQYEERPGLPPGQPITPGRQDLHAFVDSRYVRSYLLIDLVTGTTQMPVDAPDGTSRDWYGFRLPRWSPNGQSVLLPNTFLPLDVMNAEETQKRRTYPCASVVSLSTRKVECILPRVAESESGKDFEEVDNARFDSLDSDKVLFDFGYGERKKSVAFRRSNSGRWERLDISPPASNVGKIAVAVKQDLNEPPVLVARDRATKVTRAFWDPNPQFKDIKFGEVSVLHWKDNTGFEWEADLVNPPDFIPGTRYPLVIQTHGAPKNTFITYGSLPTAFAARELASAGIMVLLMPDHLEGVESTPSEAPRHVTGFKSAVEMLAARGLIDPQRVGIVGFSRTCYYVMQALTERDLHLAAASITDGITYSYWQTLGFFDYGSAHDDDSVIGAPPFGSGLKVWVDRSPDFNLDKVSAPLLVVGQGNQGIFEQWGEYAGLRYQKKPVELLDLGGDDYEHILTNPQKILASRGSTVDWFRFWLKGEEDPDPAKAEQYLRWRELRKQQEATATPEH